MPMTPPGERYLALDLGAESGRALVGAFDGDRLAVVEVHRFPNRPVRLPSGLHWDVLALYAECRAGIAAAGRDGPLASLGVDAWGLDFALLDARGALLGNPYTYRDARTDGMLDVAYARVPREEIFEQTGIQLIAVNSLYQLLAARRAGDPALDVAATFLTIPDVMAYWLTGERACEMTNATTTQCFNPRTGTWAVDLLEHLDVPARIFPPVVPPGTVLGRLSDAGAGGPGGTAPRVVVPASHDTASAVAGTPLLDADRAFISSGTWSLVGMEVPAPIVTPAALAFNLANEGGVAGRTCLLRNVTGLWLIQEVRRAVAREARPTTYAELTDLARVAAPFRAVIDPDHPDFVRPDGMPAAIRATCRATGQDVPEDLGQLVRTALEGLALRYRWTIDGLERVTGRPVRAIHVVGGGARNGLLCQMTADATGRPVLAGPAEATAIGNVLVQAVAAGRLGSIEQGRELVARSFPTEVYEPGPRAPWDAAFERFLRLTP